MIKEEHSEQDGVSDQHLLRQFVNHRSEAAFSQIVRRHHALVYGTCKRELEDAELAKDVTQVVFMLLARKAASLRGGTGLAGWLFQAACFASKNALRQERRRQRREQNGQEVFRHERAAEADQPLDQSDLWERIEPCLNDALARLKPDDREAVLLRFFEGHSLAEVGMRLGVSENTVRMRITRSLDRMRRNLAHQGVVMGVALLAGLLTSRAFAAPSVAFPFPLPSDWSVFILGPKSPKVNQLMQGVLKAMLKAMWIKTATSLIVIAAIFAVSLTAASAPKTVPTLSVRQASHPTPLGEFYTDQQPPSLETLILPDAVRGQSGTAGGGAPLPSGGSSLNIMTFTSPSSFKAVCGFYTDRLLPPGSRLQAVGVEGNLKKQSGYSLDEGPRQSAATFSQRASTYSISAFVHRGIQDKVTSVTLIFGRS